MDVVTNGGRIRACCSVGTVNIYTDCDNSAEFDRPLGLELLAEIDDIKSLGGINITQTKAGRLLL